VIANMEDKIMHQMFALQKWDVRRIREGMCINSFQWPKKIYFLLHKMDFIHSASIQHKISY